MRNIWIMVAVIVLSLQPVFGVTNMLINGETSLVVNEVGIDLTCTADISAPGARVGYYLYEDLNGNGLLDDADRIQFNGSVQDGIGWIGLLRHPLEAIIGDQNGRDGTLEVSLPLVEDLVNRLPNGTIFIVIKDEDNSQAMVTIHLNCGVTGTLVSGKITGPDGEAVAGAMLDFGCNRADGYYWKTAHTNSEGIYLAVLPFADTWTLRVVDGNGGFYHTLQAPDLVVIEGENNTADFQLTKTDATLEGHVTFADGTPVAGAALSFQNANWNTISSTTDENGYYNVGAIAGNMSVVAISPPATDDSYFVAFEKYSAIPITANQTMTHDFTAIPYTAWISGDVFFQDDQAEAPNAGNTVGLVTVNVKWTDTASGKTYENTTASLADGSYRLGLTAGTVTEFSAFSNLMAGGPLDANLPTTTINSGDSISDIDMAIARSTDGTLTVTGTVQNVAGSPIPNAYVAVFNPWIRLPDTQGFTVTGTDGGYVIPYIASLYMPGSAGGAWNPDYLTGVYAEGYSPNPDVNIIDDQTPAGEVVLDYTLSAETGVENTTTKPAIFKLHQNYPNPFNAGTFIYYDLPQAGEVKLSVYNTNGQIVEQLVSGYRTKGTHAAHWKATNLSSGQYLLRLVAGEYCAIKKCTLIK